jgi:hypothetical protein
MLMLALSQLGQDDVVVPAGSNGNVHLAAVTRSFVRMTKPTALPVLPAYRVGLVARRLLLAPILGVSLVIGAVAASNADLSDLSDLMGSIGVVLFVTLSVAGFVLLGITALQSRRELERSYTTMPGANLDHEQRDPYRGRVIRGAGSPLLNRSAFREELRASKSIGD